MAPDDLHPSRPPHVGERLARGVRVERLVDQRLQRHDRGGRVLRRVLAEHRAGTARRTSRASRGSAAPGRPSPGADPRPRSRGTPAAASAPISAHRASITARASGSCSRLTTTVPSLMMPAFSPATSAIVEPSSGWSSAIGVSTATSPRTRFVASHVPAHPHLEHAERHRLVREPQVRERAQRLEVRDLLLALRVDQHQERQQVLVLLGELLLRDVDPAHREPLADGHEVRRRVQPRREPVRARELGRHARRGPLAVRAGDVDRRIRQLRVGQQRREREDPRQVGHHAALAASLELGDGFPEVQRDQPPSSASCATISSSCCVSLACFSRSDATTSSAAFARNPSFASLAVERASSVAISSRCFVSRAASASDVEESRRQVDEAVGERQRDPPGGLVRHPDRRWRTA